MPAWRPYDSDIRKSRCTGDCAEGFGTMAVTEESTELDAVVAPDAGKQRTAG